MNFDEFRLPQKHRATLVSIVCEKFDEHKTDEQTERSLIELRELLRTLDIPSGIQIVQHKKNLDSATMLGSGKWQEIAEQAKNDESDLIVVDFELTSSQARNIKKITGFDVIDRVNVILEIFALHAQTKDAKLQIEISRLQYLLPRLSSMWTHFSKQKGGIGQKGEGEQQLELDRRIIRDKIEHYKEQLAIIVKGREQQRKKRQHQAIIAALVGYTNAGKSSLMNRLCRVQVLEEDKLFATLDSTYRTLNPETKPPMILVDTVGFISNLPNTLIEGFKTTLESALEADLLLIVCDLSDPYYEKHLEVTDEVLKELGLEEKKRMIVFTKKDLLQDPFKHKFAQKKYPDSFVVSTMEPADMDELRKTIINYFLDQQEHYELFIPYEDGEGHSKVLGKTNVLNTVNHENGIFYKICIPDFIFHNLGLQQYILAPNDRMSNK